MNEEGILEFEGQEEEPTEILTEKRRIYSDKPDRSIYELCRQYQKGNLELRPEFQRLQVWDNGSNPTCAICGQKIHVVDDAEIDHVEHYWRRGKTTPANARLTHRYCNRSRPMLEKEGGNAIITIDIIQTPKAGTKYPRVISKGEKNAQPGISNSDIGIPYRT